MLMPMKESFTAPIVRVLILMAVFICPVAASAQESENPSDREYVKLIEEGKTWEYLHMYTCWDRFTLNSFQMHFDGTEIRDGIEYSKLVYCGNQTQWKVDYEDAGTSNYIDWRDLPPFDITSQPNYFSNYFLMREEDGKVYLYIRDLVDGDIVSYNEDHSYWEFVKPGDEAILYDFTKEEGEIIENVFCNVNPYPDDIYPFSPAEWCFMDLTVTRVSEIDLYGKRLILQDFGNARRRPSCLEGIGVVTAGILPFINQADMLTGMEHGEYYLNCLYDANGDIIYKGDNYVDVAKIIELAEVAQPTVNLAIERTGDGIRAEGAEITLYDLSGRVVASGYESLPTISLQPGVYVAKAQSPYGISTLKLKVD